MMMMMMRMPRKMKTSGNLNGKSINKLFSFLAFSFSTFLYFSYSISCVGCSATATSVYTPPPLSPYSSSDSPLERTKLAVSKIPVPTSASITNPQGNNNSIFSKISIHTFTSQNQNKSGGFPGFPALKSKETDWNGSERDGNGKDGKKTAPTMMMTLQDPGKFLRIRRSFNPNSNSKLYKNPARSTKQKVKEPELVGSNSNINMNGDDNDNEKYSEGESGMGMGMGIGDLSPLNHLHPHQLQSEDDIMRLLSQIIRNKPTSPLTDNGAGDADGNGDGDADEDEPLELESLFAGKNPLLGQVQIQRPRHGQGNLYSDDSDDHVDDADDDYFTYSSRRKSETKSKSNLKSEPGNLNEWMDVDVEAPLSLFKHRSSSPKSKSKPKSTTRMRMRMRRGGIGTGSGNGISGWKPNHSRNNGQSHDLDLLRSFLYLTRRN